jgi:hypothetical protein
MLRRSFAGFDVIVENPKGSVRQWYDREAKLAGQTEMLNDYGFLDGHIGVDGDEVDCYLGDHEDAPFVFVVHQLKAPEYERHDEDKVFLGFRDEDEARKAFQAHRNDTRAYGGMSSIPTENFRAKLERRQGTGKIRHEANLEAPTFEIVKRADGYYVLSENGKHLGGPYGSRDAAEERLRQVEQHKHMDSSGRTERIAGSVRFDAGDAGGGQVRTGVWDRICVPGENIKDGEHTEFTAETCGQMVANFGERGDPVMIDWNHQSSYAHANGQPAPALGFYGALAAVFGGQVTACEYANGVDQQLPPATLEDGLWGLRTDVTPKGHELLPGFKLLSPTFTPEGVNQLGEDIGYCLLAVAATNTPWQAGTRITFEGAVDMAVAWWKVYTDRSPNGTFVQANSAEEAMATAERDGRGKATRAEPQQHEQVSMASPGDGIVCPGCGLHVPVAADGTIAKHSTQGGSTGTPCGSAGQSAKDLRAVTLGKETAMANVGDVQAGDYVKDKYGNWARVEAVSGDSIQTVQSNGATWSSKHSQIAEISKSRPAGFQAATNGSTGASRAKGARIMSIANAARAVGMEPTANPKEVRRAFVQHFEDEAKKAAMEEGYNYEEQAKHLEEMAKSYEDAKFEEEEGEADAPHVVMRKMATHFRKLAKMGDPPFGGKETPSEEAAEEATKHEGEGAEMEEEDDKDKDEEKKAAMAMAKRLGLPAKSSLRQIAMAMEGRTTSLDKVGKLESRIAEMEAQRATEVRNERARSAFLAFDSAVSQGRTKPEKRDVFIAAYQRNPKDAEALLFAPGTFASKEVLMHRMTAGGAPLGVDPRDVGTSSALDQRVVSMSALGSGAKALVFGENLSNVITAMADSDDPKVRARIDHELPEGVKGTKFESYERYMAADRIVRKDRPDLVRAANPDA